MDLMRAEEHWRNDGRAGAVYIYVAFGVICAVGFVGMGLGLRETKAQGLEEMSASLCDDGDGDETSDDMVYGAQQSQETLVEEGLLRSSNDDHASAHIRVR